MSVQSVLVRKSTKEIIKHALYPRDDMSPFLEGEIDPDYEWLAEYIPYLEPDYDSRIYILVTNLPNLEFLSSFQDHPNYPGIKAYTVTYSPEKRPREDIVRSIENAEKDANSLVWSESVHKDKMIFMLNSVLKAANGLQLTVDEQSQIDQLTSIAVKLTKNLDNRNLLVSLLDLNQIPNIDSGWVSA